MFHAPRPLTSTDDREAFDCGREPINRWLQRHALVNHLAGATRTNVVTVEETGNVAGFVALCSAEVERSFLPKPGQRNMPAKVAVTLLAQLAVDRQFQGQGLARGLLMFALRTALSASRYIGSIGVLTHPIDDTVRTFYGRWQFEELPFDPNRSMLVRMRTLETSILKS